MEPATIKVKIKVLTTEKNLAVMEGKYHRAAQLRDKIAELTTKLKEIENTQS